MNRLDISKSNHRDSESSQRESNVEIRRIEPTTTVSVEAAEREIEGTEALLHRVVKGGFKEGVSFHVVEKRSTNGCLILKRQRFDDKAILSNIIDVTPRPARKHQELSKDLVTISRRDHT